MADRQTVRLMEACRDYLLHPNGNTIQKLKEALAEESRKSQGLSQELADRALDVASEHFASEEDVSFDDISSTEFSVADAGLHVSAWVWVPNKALGILPEPHKKPSPKVQKVLDKLTRQQMEILLGEGGGGISGCGCRFLPDKTDDEMREGVAGFLDEEEIELETLEVLTEDV